MKIILRNLKDVVKMINVESLTDNKKDIIFKICDRVDSVEVFDGDEYDFIEALSKYIDDGRIIYYEEDDVLLVDDDMLLLFGLDINDNIILGTNKLSADKFIYYQDELNNMNLNR